MDIAVEILDSHLQPIRWEDSSLFYIALTQLAVVSLVVRHTMCTLSILVRYGITTVLIAVYLQCYRVGWF